MSTLNESVREPCWFCHQATAEAENANNVVLYGVTGNVTVSVPRCHRCKKAHRTENLTSCAALLGFFLIGGAAAFAIYRTMGGGGFAGLIGMTSSWLGVGALALMIILLASGFLLGLISVVKWGDWMLPAGIASQGTTQEYPAVAQLLRQGYGLTAPLRSETAQASVVNRIKVSPENEASSARFPDIVKLTRTADVAGLLRAFSLGNWETRELVAAAFGNVCRDSKPDVDYDRREMVAALRSIVDLCSADATGDTYRQNCLDHARMLLNRPEFSQPQPAEQADPLQLTAAESDGPIHIIKVNVEKVRAIFIGFTSIETNESEAHHHLSVLMEQWNPKLYEAFNKTQASVKIGAYSAPSADLLHLKLAAVRDEEYPDCLAILQTGVFDIVQRDTGSHVRADVFLATLIKTPAEKMTVAAHGPELTLVPEGTPAADSAVSVSEFCEAISAKPRVDPEPSNAEALYPQGLDNSALAGGVSSAESVAEILDTIAARLRVDPNLCVHGVHILKFPDGFEAAYRNHLSFIEQLKSTWIYPSLDVYGLRSASADASVARLILITGDIAAFEQLNDALYTREAKRVVDSHHGGNCDAINPACSISNLPKAGISIDIAGVIEEVERLRREIRTGAYEVERTLSWDWHG